MTRYGYVRVSSKDQNPDRQISAMNECGVDKSCIFVDKMSGKNFNCPNYKKMLRRLREGDPLQTTLTNDTEMLEAAEIADLQEKTIRDKYHYYGTANWDSVINMIKSNL